jgi:hypothetical protein
VRRVARGAPDSGVWERATAKRGWQTLLPHPTGNRRAVSQMLSTLAVWPAQEAALAAAATAASPTQRLFHSP